MTEPYTLSRGRTVAVATEVFLQPMDTCPIGVKVQLLTVGGILVYGTWRREPHYVGWAPVPRRHPDVDYKPMEQPNAVKNS